MFLTRRSATNTVEALVTAISRDTLHRLIDCGICASSADNGQPWRFALRERAIDVAIARTGAFYDVDSLPSYFAIGGVVENLRIAAAQEGYAADVTRFPRGEHSDLVATVILREDAARMPVPLYPLVAERCTNRRPYSRRPPSPSTLRELQEAVAAQAGFRLALLQDRPSVKATAGLIRDADRIRFEHERTHHEFHAKLRFTQEEQERTGDGLSIQTLELGPLGGPLLRFLRPWRRTARLNRWGLSRLLAFHAYVLTRRSGALGLLAGPAPDPSVYLRGGELFQRLWLHATGARLALQPMAALPLYLLRLARARSPGFEPRHLETLGASKVHLHELFGLGAQENPMMLFRLGYARDPSARSLRRRSWDPQKQDSHASFGMGV